MCAPETLEEMAVNLTWSGPAFRGAEYDHWPARAGHISMLAGRMPMFTNFVDATLHGRSHGLVHAIDFGTFYEIRSPAIAAKQALEFLARDSRQQSWVIDLVSIEVENREYGAIPCGIQELVDVP